MTVDTFKARAAQWDNPDKIAMTQTFLGEMLLHLQPQPDWKALEIGAGTGLVGLHVAPLVHTLIVEDTSEAMLEVLKLKLAGDNNVKILHGELFDYNQTDIDFVFSYMAFHHLPDVEKALQHIAYMTKSGAYVVVGDLVTEDGSFHRFEPIPYCGFGTALLSQQFIHAGFAVKLVKIYHVLSRQVNEKLTNYEQFILVAQRM